MRVLISVDCVNAAFEGDPVPELRRILGSVPDKVYDMLPRDGPLIGLPGTCRNLLDINGNSVGKVFIEFPYRSES